MSKHRKPTTTRRVIRNALVMCLLMGTLMGVLMGLGALASAAGASTHHQHTSANNTRLCAAVTTWMNHGQAGDAERWTRYLPGTGRWLYWDGMTLVFAIGYHAPRGVLWQATDHVWSDCHPNTGG